jgi:hypothetical protein
MQALPKAAPAATTSSTIVILKPPSADRAALIAGLGFRMVPWFQENGFIAEDRRRLGRGACVPKKYAAGLDMSSLGGALFQTGL